jgi:outer membrane lipase/esterase
MKTKLLVCQLLLIYALLPLPVMASNTSFSNIFVFGDSLSDNGNLASLPQYSFLNSRPFNHGFSNGKFAVEVLAKNFNIKIKPSLYFQGRPKGNNYAVYGATARNQGNASDLFNLTNQVDEFLTFHNHSAPANALYIIFIGANDVFDALTPGNDPNQIIGSAVDGIENAINDLVTNGAEAILVINVPDVGLTPKIRAFGEPVVNAATALTSAFNSALLSRLNQVEQQLQKDFVYLDFFQLSQRVAADSKAMGYTNITEACFDSVNLVFNSACNGGENFNDFIYFDSVHLTADAHNRLARAMYTVVPELPK